jgi:starch synthase
MSKYQELIFYFRFGNTGENELNSLLPDYKGNYNTFIGYNEVGTLICSSRFLLMPSRVEPCGLNQMYSFDTERFQL